MSRKEGYNETGVTYEQGRYGSRWRKAYLRRRCETLAGLIRQLSVRGRPLRILEIGCGTGVTLDYLTQLPTKHELYGADFSITMASQAYERTRSSENPPTVVLADARELPFANDTFDLVYATRFIHQFHHPEKKKVVAELRRITRDRGYLALEFYARNYNWFRYHTDHRELYDSCEEYFTHYPSNREVRDLMGSSFRSVVLGMAAARWINRILGYRGLCLGLNLARMPVVRNLIDEYWVMAANQPAPKEVGSEGGHEPAPKSEHGAADLGAEAPDPARCPRCKGRLDRRMAENNLRCNQCLVVFEIREGIANLLFDEASPLTE